MWPTDWLIDLLGRRIQLAAMARSFRRLIAKDVVRFGAYSYGIPDIREFEGSCSKLIVGRYVSITSGATFLLGGNHPVDWVSLYPFRARFGLDYAYADGMPSSKGDIVVGHGAWIGHGALILSGVTIGNGAVVGAGSVVAKDVPPYGIVVGNPARILRYRFSEEDQARMEADAWWERDPIDLIPEVDLLSSAKIKEYLDRSAQVDGDR